MKWIVPEFAFDKDTKQIVHERRYQGKHFPRPAISMVVKLIYWIIYIKKKT